MPKQPPEHEAESRLIARKNYMKEYHIHRRLSATPEGLEAMRQKSREVSRRWFENHPDKAREVRKRTITKNHSQRLQDTQEWKSKNKTAVAIYNKAWHAKNTERAKVLNAKWYAQNMPAVKAKKTARYQSDPQFKIKVNLRSRIYTVLKRRMLLGYKSQSTMKLVGCSIDELMQHIESQFLPGMSWENHGDWHIDHKRPCASFDLTDPEQQKECFHYKNLQPLWKADNIRKSDRWAA